MKKKELRGEIHLGDLAEAVAALPCNDPEHLEIIAACLGFRIEKKDQKRNEPKKIIDPNQRRHADKRQNKNRDNTPLFPPLPDPDIPISLPDATAEGVLTEASERMPAAPQDPDWLKEKPILPKQELDLAPNRLPLLNDNISRGIFSSLLATKRKGADIDIHRLIDDVVKRKQLHRLPLISIGTLEKGCQLLLDYGNTMTPYWEDLASLEHQIASLLGPESLKTYRFSENPGSAQRWTATGKAIPWRPDNCPILVATDFGVIGRSIADIQDTGWPEFINQCEKAGCPLLILNPWAEERWPENLGSHPELIHWSPSTTASMIRQVIGVGHEMPI